LCNRPGALSEIWIGRGARGYQLRGDLRQRFDRAARLRPVLHDRPNAVGSNAVSGLGCATFESGLLAGCDDLSASAGASRRLRFCDRCSEDDRGADRAHSQSVSLHARYSPLRPALP
jgi:hypothetical protein